MDIPVQPRQRGVKNVPGTGSLTGLGLGKQLMGKKMMKAGNNHVIPFIFWLCRNPQFMSCLKSPLWLL
jgi:hypothetical protein